MAKCRCSFACLALTSLVVLVPTIALYVTLSDIFLAIVKKQAVLAPGSEVLKQWQNPEVPIYVYFYFYNILNPDEFKSGSKPAFEQVGPFVYREHRVKYDLQFMFDDTVVQYRMNHYFTPEPDLSVKDPRNFTVTTLNVPLAIILSIESHVSSPLQREIISLAAKFAGEQELFVEKTVDELLWGYDDPIFALIHKLDASIPAQFSLQQKNITDDANLWSRVFTGKGDSSLIGTYTQWHQMVHLPYWGSAEANAINGTEGFLFHPGIKSDEKLYGYIDNLFRSGYFLYNGSGTVEDIDVIRFVIPKFELENATVNPNNVAFYSDGPGGMMNMSALNPMHPPIFMSKPHFLDTPPAIINSVVGLKPDPSEHDSFMDVHALSGGVLCAHKRMQINVLVKPAKSKIFDTSRVRETFFPILYVDETATITPTLAAEFRARITTPKDAASAGLLALMILCGGGLLTCLAVLAYRRRSEPQQQQQRQSSHNGAQRATASSLNDGSDTETTALLR